MARANYEMASEGNYCLAWRVEHVCTLYRGKRLHQMRLRDDRNRIVCFGFGNNATSAFLRLSTHAQGSFTPAFDWRNGKQTTFPVILPGELPLALLALERFQGKK